MQSNLDAAPLPTHTQRQQTHLLNGVQALRIVTACKLIHRAVQVFHPHLGRLDALVIFQLNIAPMFVGVDFRA